ncbi:MAG: hemolysin III family protein [Ruminococcaceae bacterium]|nr:hemolysin III family protein [Oscillospiraceae bacterium]
MNKNKLYTVGEEIFNSVSHGVGAAISVAACVLMIIRAAIVAGAIEVVSVSIFGACLILLYISSTLYHALTNETAKKVFRIFDHCMIFILIAGTYTPFNLVALGGGLGWTFFGILWGTTILGVVLNALSLNKFKKLSLVLYVIMGWCAIFAIKPIVTFLGIWGSILLLGGGIFYTVGILFYSKKDIRYMHSVWHIFVVLGSVCHILCVLFYIIK